MLPPNLMAGENEAVCHFKGGPELGDQAKVLHPTVTGLLNQVEARF